jgi:hypothetical protein
LQRRERHQLTLSEGFKRAFCKTKGHSVFVSQQKYDAELLQRNRSFLNRDLLHVDVCFVCCDEIAASDIREHCPSSIPSFPGSSYHNSTWQAFFEESKLVFRMTFLLESFLDYSLRTTKPGLASTRRLGMFEGQGILEAQS